VRTLSRWVYLAACTALYAMAAVVLGLALLIGWTVFVVYVLHGMGCDGSCNWVGDVTYDYWFLWAAVATTLTGLLLLPFYRRLIRGR
jgi:hypothetical protein